MHDFCSDELYLYIQIDHNVFALFGKKKFLVGRCGLNHGWPDRYKIW